MYLIFVFEFRLGDTREEISFLFGKLIYSAHHLQAVPHLIVIHIRLRHFETPLPTVDCQLWKLP